MKFTAFEQEVAAMTARGKRAVDIAKATGRSYDAVYRARTRIRDKLGIDGTEDLRLRELERGTSRP